ncbi:nickel ABC transporter permease [Romboutsia sp.]|uniref:nickel ABC transporter permease n=1 Tax=Romboutsia sp. TaxID=1965302 RepID=UPI002CD18112|nr:nickel ABC transporter permease [Romboutsia sp.]HSQ88234.1 nickel ABC transporter permease [Romboutsia sp.]
MGKYIFRRMIYLIPVIIGVSIITFGLSQIAPGDPAEIILRENGIEPTKEAIQHLREQLKINDPIIKQYVRWFLNVLNGDLGNSFYTKQPVLQEITSRLPATFELAIFSYILTIIISFPLGIFSAIYKNTWIDNLSRCFAFIGSSMPSYWLGLILIYFLSVKLSIFPVMGRGTLKHLLLPALTLALGMASTYARLLRGSMLEVLGEDFILSARARGIREFIVIYYNALKKALLPVVTSLGISFGYLLGGTVIVENIFAWPGVGQLLVEAIFTRDYPVIQGYVLWMSIIFVFVNLIVDILYKFLDPRISIQKGSNE